MHDPLPSWHDGAAKAAILDFVARVTQADGPDFVPPEDRIVTFDNDGTLWCEQPFQTQLYFARDRLDAMAQQDPSLRERQPFKAYLERDQAMIRELGKHGLFEAGAAAHAGMTEDTFYAYARDWLARARHPQLDRLFTDLVYQPQLELLAHLRDRAFKIFIVSGGGIDLIRAFSEEVYGIPRDQVVGSNVQTRLSEERGRIELIKLAELGSFDDREAKVQNIALHIGRRPILAFGNSDGDLAMLRYTNTGAGPRLALLLHHDDAAREFAYDRDFHLSPLAEALDKAADYGIHVVSMQRDWATVFPGAAQ
jgi:phosphoserine phosphatase